MIEVKIICDSISKKDKRITTFVLKYPRYIHSELMTHRMLSRNSSSSRAITPKKFVQQIVCDPVIPIHWGKTQSGMQARKELSTIKKFLARRLWLLARFPAVLFAKLLNMVGLHGQITNRLLEPWAYISVICTSTEWDNFYSLRCDSNAHPDIQDLAEKMLNAHNQSVPKVLDWSQWHLPFILDSDRSYPNCDLIKFSVARCARVSYLNHDKSKPNPEKDRQLFEKLLANGHMSPFEHQASPSEECIRSGNFIGWNQYRKSLISEHRNNFDRLLK
jgi:hypothetical protein